VKTGTIVKISQVGLDHLYPVHDSLRKKAEGKRFKYCGVDRNDLDVVRVKRLTSDSYLFYHETFIEPAN